MSNRDIGEYLKEQGRALTAPVGRSMLPALREDKCQVLLVYPKTSPKKYDVVLYRSSGGKLILHRILEEGEDGCTLLGDNTYVPEKHIQREQILGVMQGFFRGEKWISAESPGYRGFVVLWWRLFPVRRAAWRIYRWGKGRLHK